MSDKKCPCSGGSSYQACCGKFIDGDAIPQTPEQLMRSRYTAYSLVNIDYIVRTMAGPAAEGYDKVTAKAWAESLTWLGLKVLSAEQSDGGDVGFVEFVAKFREGGHAAQKMKERSEFHRINGRWYYWNGDR